MHTSLSRVAADEIEHLDILGEYTPVLLSVGTNPNIGSTGTAIGRWHKQGHWVSGDARIQFSGTGIDPGAGTYLVTPPWPIDPGLIEESGTGAQASSVGFGRIRDNSDSSLSRIVNVMVIRRGLGELMLWMQPTGSNAAVGATTPFTWASNDNLSLNYRYPTPM